MRFDLHMHTRHSDGELSPSEILSKAKKIGLDGVSITDHDTISAYPEAFALGEKLGLKILSGIEISCLQGEKSVHVLGYAFSIKDPSLLSFIKNCQEMRRQRNLLMIEKLNEYNIDIGVEDLATTFQRPLEEMGRPHLARLLIQKGVCKNFQEAFSGYLGDNKKCYVLGHRPSVLEAIDVLHKANAFAVIAHPHLARDNALVQELLKMPFDGIEGYYAKFLPHQEKQWVRIAEKKKWLITGGSDFHGDNKPINELGCSWISEETFDPMLKRQKENEDGKLPRD